MKRKYLIVTSVTNTFRGLASSYNQKNKLLTINIKCIVLIAIIVIFHTSKIKAQLNIDTSSFNSIFQQVTVNNQSIIVIGEAHDVKNTLAVELFIINNLQKKINTIYLEGGKSEAELLNLFLKTGDTTLLEFTRARNLNNEYKSFLTALYQKENKNELNFKGFDFERPICVGYLFSKWFKNITITINNINLDSLSQQILLIDTIEDLTMVDVKRKSWELQRILTIFRNAFHDNEEEFEDILNTNFSIFEQIIENPVLPNSNRDKKIANMLMQEEKEEGLGNILIITGAYHLLSKSGFVTLLIKQLPPKYTILDFIFIYKNCESLDAEGARKFNSKEQLLLNLSSVNETKSLIRFSVPQKKLLLIKNKKIETIIAEFYNQ